MTMQEIRELIKTLTGDQNEIIYEDDNTISIRNAYVGEIIDFNFIDNHLVSIGS